MSEATVKVSRALQEIAGELQKMIDDAAGEHVAFSLFVWTEGRASYISTADRADVIPVLEQSIERWKQGMPDVPAHQVD